MAFFPSRGFFFGLEVGSGFMASGRLPVMFTSCGYSFLFILGGLSSLMLRPSCEVIDAKDGKRGIASHSHRFRSSPLHSLRLRILVSEPSSAYDHED